MSLRVEFFGVVAALEFLLVSLSVALKCPRRARVRSEWVDETEMGLPTLALRAALSNCWMSELITSRTCGPLRALGMLDDP